MKMLGLGLFLIAVSIYGFANNESIGGSILCAIIGIALLLFKFRMISEKQIETKSPKTKRHAKSEDAMRKHDAYNAFMARWKPVVDEHYRLSQQSDKLYADCVKAGLVDGPLVQSVIELCQQDICLEEQFREYELERIQMDMGMGYTDITSMPKALTGYSSFKRLAIIYEKQKRYEDAIAVCQCAIDAGRIDDGTKGMMTGRIVKLQKKLEKERLDNAVKIDFDNPFI